MQLIIQLISGEERRNLGHAQLASILHPREGSESELRLQGIRCQEIREILYNYTFPNLGGIAEWCKARSNSWPYQWVLPSVVLLRLQNRLTWTPLPIPIPQILLDSPKCIFRTYLLEECKMWKMHVLFRDVRMDRKEHQEAALVCIAKRERA